MQDEQKYVKGIMGIERPDKGKVILEGKTLSIRHPSDAMKAVSDIA